MPLLELYAQSGPARFGLKPRPEPANSTLQAPPPPPLSAALPALSRGPPLPLRPGGEQSATAVHGRRSGRDQEPPRDRWRRIPQILTSLRHLCSTRSRKRSMRTGLWDMNFAAPPSLVTCPGARSIGLFPPALPGAVFLRNKCRTARCVLAATWVVWVLRAAGASDQSLLKHSNVPGDTETLVNLPNNRF